MWLLLVVMCTASSSAAQENTQVIPLKNAHAHNDYYHDRPLLDALDHGFCSVEADIFLSDGELLVAHSRFELRKENTLSKLYLDPLKERIAKNGGHVYPDGPPFTLLVDIKTDGERVYEVLREELEAYREMLSGLHDGRFERRAIQIVISGDRPRARIVADTKRLVGIDGRLSDLDSDSPADLLPLISDRWTSHFKWRGEGEFSDDERTKLREIVRQAHEAGRRVRFWATPEDERVWEELSAAGVDHINTDRLSELRDFLLEKQQ